MPGVKKFLHTTGTAGNKLSAADVHGFGRGRP